VALDGAFVSQRVCVVTATGKLAAVERTARAGFEVVDRVVFRDHHWFTSAEAETPRPAPPARSVAAPD
jgi:tetraacyldisaccharide-1-P 4'-kinase